MLWLQLRKLKRARGEARAQAAHALAERGNRRAVVALGEALGDVTWSERAAAAVALGKLGNGRGVPFLASALAGDPEVDVRCSCAWALGSIGGKSAIEPLAGALDDDSDAVRRVVTEALAEIGTAPVLDSLVRALSDPHHDVRLAAVAGLGRVGRGPAAPWLLEALQDPEWSVASAAAEALAHIDDSTALPALFEALRGGHLAACLAAAEALGRVGDPSALDALVAALGDPARLTGVDGCDLRLRRNVARALGAIGKAEAVAPLCTLVADRFTAGAAVEALVKVLRWDAANIAVEELRELAVLEDPHQSPWIIDETEEAGSGRIVVREGRPWPVDASELRAIANTELRARED